MGSLQQLETRVRVLEDDMQSVKTTVNKVSDDTDTILTVITASKGAYGLIRRHFPRVIAFGIGIAVAKGWISADLANLIKGF